MDTGSARAGTPHLTRVRHAHRSNSRGGIARIAVARAPDSPTAQMSRDFRTGTRHRSEEQDYNQVQACSGRQGLESTLVRPASHPRPTRSSGLKSESRSACAFIASAHCHHRPEESIW